MIETYRRVAKYEQNCSVCLDKILKGDSLTVIIGGTAISHKKCEPMAIEREIQRRERRNQK